MPCIGLDNRYVQHRFFVAQNVQTIQQMQHSQPLQLISEKNPTQKVEGEIVETLADFFQRGNTAAPILNLNYLLNEFLRSNSFPEIELEEYLCKSLKVAETLC